MALSEEEAAYFAVPKKERLNAPSALGLSPKTAKLMSTIWTVIYKAVAPHDTEALRELFGRHNELLKARLTPKLGTECTQASVLLQDGLRRAIMFVRAGETPTLTLGEVPDGRVGVFMEHRGALNKVKESHATILPTLRAQATHSHHGGPPEGAFALRYNRLADQQGLWGLRPDPYSQNPLNKRRKTESLGPAASQLPPWQQERHQQQQWQQQQWQQQQQQQQACKYFAQGHCAYGGVCQFSHEPGSMVGARAGQGALDTARGVAGGGVPPGGVGQRTGQRTQQSCTEIHSHQHAAQGGG